MNYITRLQSENAALTAELEALRSGLTDLRSYLASDKFATDSTVQVADVFNRLRDAENAATDARVAA
jgi:hypothetical protein